MLYFIGWALGSENAAILWVFRWARSLRLPPRQLHQGPLDISGIGLRPSNVLIEMGECVRAAFSAGGMVDLSNTIRRRHGP